MESISPVFTEDLVEFEKVIALGQEPYRPIIGLPVRYDDGTLGIAVRFELNEEERKKISEGADLIISELTFGGLFTPINISFHFRGARPE